MIKQLIFLFFLLLGFGCISQVEFYSHNSLGYDTTNILNGTTVNISDDSSFFELTMGFAPKKICIWCISEASGDGHF